jgi:hypothetical protein
VKGWIAKKRRGFLPADEEVARMHVQMKDGECVLAEFIQPRSVPWHRMYFGICREIGKNQDPPRDEASIDHELRVRAGHFDVFWVDGHECRVPKRIAFAKLTAREWEELWPSLDLAIREHFGDEYIRESQKTGTW